jgi:hypothetical protein
MVRVLCRVAVSAQALELVETVVAVAEAAETIVLEVPEIQVKGVTGAMAQKSTSLLVVVS